MSTAEAALTPGVCSAPAPRPAQALRAFVMSELLPGVERLSARATEEDELSDELWALIAGAPDRLLDARAEDHAGLDVTRLTVAAEALATGRQTGLMPILLTALPSIALLLDGSPAQQERHLGPVRAGVRRAAFALSEADAGSDVAAMTTVVDAGPEGLVVTGRKSWISVPGRADWFLVFAKPVNAERDHHLSCLVVPADAPGLRMTPTPGQPLGMRAVALCDVELDGVTVSPDHLVGVPGGAFGLAMRTLNAVRPIVAARGLGLTASVLMAATEYVERRAAFGGALKDLQLVRAKLGSLSARLEAARLLTYHAARLVDTSGPGKEQAPALAAAKLLATELAVEAATTCLHLAGAAGYTDRLPFERALRDAQQLTIVEGTSEVQLELVARGLFDRTLWWSGGRA
jgi:hypothetical protein